MAPTAPCKHIEELLPHRAPMMLLSSLLDWGDDFIEVSVDHSTPSLFSDENGNIPSWVGIEYMAQAISAFAGIESKKKGLPVSIGFLLGTRKYQVFTECFNAGEQLIVRAERTYRSEDNIVQFHCLITCNGERLATSDIKAIQPENPEDIVKVKK